MAAQDTLDPAAQPPPGGLPRRAVAIIIGVSAATALGNTGLISVLPAIGRSIGLADEDTAAPPRASAEMALPGGGLPKRAVAVIIGVSAATALGNTGLISVLPAIGRSIGLADEEV